MSQEIILKPIDTAVGLDGQAKTLGVIEFLKTSQALKWIVGGIFPFSILLLWYVAVEKNWVNPLLLPAPQAVWVALQDLYSSGELWSNLSVSLVRILYGFGAGITIAIFLGLGMGLSKTVEAYVWPIFKILNLVPVVGWIPLLVLVVGIDEALKIILIAKAALLPMTVNIYKGVRNIPTSLTEVADVYQLSVWSMFKNLIFPGALISFVGGLRLSLASAWGALVAVELLASSEGIGYIMVYGRQIFQLDVVMATVVIIGLVGFFFDVLISLLQRPFKSWHLQK